MKKIIAAIILLCLSASLFAQKTSSINGACYRNVNGEELKVFRMRENSKLEEIGKAKINKDRTFSFTVVADTEGVYVIGEQDVNPANRYLFYFKPGDDLNVMITPCSYELFGENTEENRMMEKWQNFILPIEYASAYSTSIDYTVFFPLLEYKLKELPSDWNKIQTNNKAFNKWFDEYKSTDIQQHALRFLFTPRSKHPSADDYIDYYKTIDLYDLTATDQLLKYPNGINLINFITMLNVNLSATSADETKKRYSSLMSLIADGNIDKIKNPIIQGELVLSMMQRVKTSTGFQEYKKEYFKYLTTNKQKEEFAIYEKKISEAIVDKSELIDATDFKFQDISGKDVSLSDFKGKVVYIDIWATWCGPCKKEIPYLMKLEEEYKGKDIVFLGVSIDKQKDHEQWKKFLTDNDMKGIQVFAGDKAPDIAKPYKVKGIPRFILVSANGKIISEDAPRPSSIEIRAVLNDILNKK